MTDFRALCAELVDDLEWCDWPYKLKETIRADIDRARAALADEPAAGEPSAIAEQLSDEELLKLAQQYSIVYLLSDGSACHPFQEGCDMRNDVLNFARAVLTRWGNPAPQPVPVSERLPGQEVAG